MKEQENEENTLERLLAVSSGKPFENLSWRLLKLLVKDIDVERRELGEGDTLKISDKMDVIHVESGTLQGPNQEKRLFDGGTFFWAKPKKSPSYEKEYINTCPVDVDAKFNALKPSIVRIFKKPRKGSSMIGENGSRWAWLCEHSRVARHALKESPGSAAEIVLLVSKDLIEYLPALTELLAQAMALNVDSAPEPLQVTLLRLDQGEEVEIAREENLFPPSFRIVAVPNFAAMTKAIAEAKHHSNRAAYVFVDPYDRASDRAAVQVKALTPRGVIPDVDKAKDKQGHPGSTLLPSQFKALLAQVDSLVHVARNFRIEDPDEKRLNFNVVVLDSRTARFEAGGTRDRRQRRNADDPVPAKLEPPEGCDDEAPTTRLHLNLLRLKKAWEQSPSLSHVCDVLDEPNAPSAGDRQGYWKASSFFERWVRDLLFRRVGVALGGGGATGFSHVALIQALREQKIPIDLVSGTSFGALAGAYYCSHGLDGLEMLTEQALLYSGVASLTILTSAFFEHLVNLSIDYRPMWELPIPLYTVATDIESGKAAVFPGPAAANPSVGFAVRASGSLPGFFAPAIAGDARYVDGGAVSIVPVRALIRFGADVVIGSNSFPFRAAEGAYRATPLRGFLPPPFGRLAERLLSELNPGNRMTDAARSLSLSLTDSMVKEITLASAVYEHKRTDVKYWEFHRAGQVLRAAKQDLSSSGALPEAIQAVRLLNTQL